MDYDYEQRDEYESRVLWGRVGVFVAVVILAFILGSCLSGRAENDLRAQVELLEAETASLEQENAQLEEQVAALSAGQGTDSPDTTTEPPADQPTEAPPTDQPTEEPPAEPTEEVRSYTVEPGDTLYSIAQEMYGDGSLHPLISQENGIDSSNRLTVGQVLRIPPRPTD